MEWQADEQYVLAAISKDEATEAFDQLWEQAVRDGMTLDEKLCQLFVVTPDALTGLSPATAAGDATREALERTPVGGLV